jgi:hypothetical protein
MREITAIQARGVAKPMIKAIPAKISVEAATIACCFDHLIPMLKNQDAVPEILLTLFIP